MILARENGRVYIPGSEEASQGMSVSVPVCPPWCVPPIYQRRDAMRRCGSCRDLRNAAPRREPAERLQYRCAMRPWPGMPPSARGWSTWSRSRCCPRSIGRWQRGQGRGVPRSACRCASASRRARSRWCAQPSPRCVVVSWCWWADTSHLARACVSGTAEVVWGRRYGG